MAQSRRGSAGELLAWRRPDRASVGHEAFKLMGVNLNRGVRVTPGLGQGSGACKYNENSDAILESASKKEDAKIYGIIVDRSESKNLKRVCVLIPEFNIKDSKVYTDMSAEFAQACDFKFATLQLVVYSCARTWS